MSREVVLSAIQPSGELHIGHYFGAIANWVQLQDTHDCVYGVVDLHAMTMPHHPQHLRRNTENTIIDLLACGIDPDKSILFVQSLIPEHVELAWILGCYCSYGDLTRQTQFKDKMAEIKADMNRKGKRITAGEFTYPLLQAADVLIYRPNVVPVGQDQKPHVELARRIARRFNNRFGDFFPEPQAMLSSTPKIGSLMDPEKKMNRLLGQSHYVGLLEDEDSIRAKIQAAITDTGVLPPGIKMSPGVANLFQMLGAARRQDEQAALEKEYEAGGFQYSVLKDAVATALVETLRPIQARRAEIARDKDGIRAAISAWSEQAREIAAVTLNEARERAGLLARDW